MSVMGPASRLRVARGQALTAMIGAVRVVGLAALVWAVAGEHRSDGSPKVPAWLLVLASAGWIGWLVGERRRVPPRVVWLFLAVLAAAGGAVAGFAPVGLAFPAVAVLVAAIGFDAASVAVIALFAALAVVVSVVSIGAPRAIIAKGLLTIVAAALGGASRRQYRERAAQAETLLAARVRAAPNATAPRHWLSATASGARSTTCWRTRSAHCRSNSTPRTPYWRTAPTRPRSGHCCSRPDDWPWRA
jgi:hypothetical protein